MFSTKAVLTWVTLKVDLSSTQILSIAQCGGVSEDVSWEREIVQEPSYVDYATKAVQIAIGWHVEGIMYDVDKSVRQYRLKQHKEEILALNMTRGIDVVTAFKTHCGNCNK